MDLRSTANFSLYSINPLNAAIYPICHSLALLGAHPICHVSEIRVNILVVVTERMFTVRYELKILIHCGRVTQICVLTR